MLRAVVKPLPRLAACTLALLIVHGAEAQDTLKRNDFFKKDHARSPLVGFEVETSGKPKARPQAQDDGERRFTDSPRSIPAATPSLAAEPGGLKILSIGAIINSYNAKHFNAEIERLLNVVDKYDLDVGEVITIGPETMENTKYDMPLLARGAVITPQFFIPAEYDIRTSPTFILATAEGQILLEGISSLERYINSRGEFIESGLPEVGEAQAPIVDKGVSFFDD